MLKRINKRTIIILGAIISLIAIFFISYVATGAYLDNKEQAKVEAQNDEDKKLAKQKDENLDDSIKVQFYNGDKIEKEKTIKELKKVKSDEMSLNELNEIATKEGYKLKNRGDNTITYVKEEGMAYEKGKYYLGFNEDKLAIFVCNDEGKLVFLENSERERSRNEIAGGAENAKKIENHEIKADTKEEIMDKAFDYST